MAKESDRKEYVVRIGPLLKDMLEKQKKKIREATYDCVDPSDYESGEVLAKKLCNVL